MADRQVGVAIVVTDKGAAVIDANGQKVREYVRTTVEGNRQIAASADQATAAEGRMAASRKHLAELRARNASGEQAAAKATSELNRQYKEAAEGALHLGSSLTAANHALTEYQKEGKLTSEVTMSMALSAQQGWQAIDKLKGSAMGSVVALGTLAVKLHELQATYIENVKVQQDAEEAEARTHDMTTRQIQQYSELAKALGKTTGELRQMAPDWRAVVELSKQNTEQGRQLASGLQKITGERTKERDATAAAAAEQKKLKDLRVEVNVVDAAAAVNAKAVAEARGTEATETRKLSASVAELQERERKFYEERRKAPPAPQQSFQPGSGNEAPPPAPSPPSGGKFGEQTAAEVAAALGLGASSSMGIGSGKQTGFGMTDPRTAGIIRQLEGMVSREGPHSAIKGAVTEFRSALQAGDLMGAQKIVDAIQNQSNVAAKMGLGGADRFGAAAFGMRQALGEANQAPDDLLRLARQNMKFVPREFRGAAEQALQDVERGGLGALPEQLRGAVEAALGGKFDQMLSALQSLIGYVSKPGQVNINGQQAGTLLAPFVSRELERNNLLTQRR